MSDAPRPPADTTRDGSREFPWKLVLWGAIALYALAVLLLNDQEAQVNFVFAKITTRLIWLILLSMALGAALALIVPRWWRSRKR
jgi:uncharacterized integral membrane protein